MTREEKMDTGRKTIVTVLLIAKECLAACGEYAYAWWQGRKPWVGGKLQEILSTSPQWILNSLLI